MVRILYAIDSFIGICESLKIVDYYVDPPYFGNMIDAGFESIGSRLKTLKEMIMKFIQGIITNYRLWKQKRKEKKEEKAKQKRSEASKAEAYHNAITKIRTKDAAGDKKGAVRIGTILAKDMILTCAPDFSIGQKIWNYIKSNYSDMLDTSRDDQLQDVDDVNKAAVMFVSTPSEEIWQLYLKLAKEHIERKFGPPDPKLLSLGSKVRDNMKKFATDVSEYTPGKFVETNTLQEIEQVEQELAGYMKELKAMRTDAPTETWNEIVQDVVAGANSVEAYLIRLNLSLRTYESNAAKGENDENATREMVILKQIITEIQKVLTMVRNLDD